MEVDSLLLANQGPVLVLACVLLAVLALAVQFLVDDGYLRDQKGQAIPGPGKRHFAPIVGHGLAMARARLQHAPTALGKQWMQEFGGGSMVGLRLMAHKLVAIAHPDLIRVVLTGNYKTFPKQKEYSRMKDLFGDGLVTASGDVWRLHRHIINPAFHAEALHHMVTTFNKHSRMLVTKWQQDAQTQACVTVAPAESMANLTFDVMAEAGFGLESNTKITGESAIREAFDALSEETNTRLADAFDWQQFLPWRYFPLKRHQAVIRRLANEVFDRRIKEKEEKRRLRAGSDIDAETRYARDLVDVLLDAFWDQVIAGDRRPVHEHAATFMIAGHETTSGTLQWTLYELARHLEIQQKCREEVRAVVGEDADVAYDHLQHFKYLQQVMKETLRMHPAIPRIARQVTEPTELGPYHLPKGTVITVSVYSAHHHKDFWDEPETFDPDRWSPERVSSTLKHPFQYIPFSAGPRNCIGQRFAQFEIQVVIAHILRSFELRLNPGCAGKVYNDERLTSKPGNFQLDLVPLRAST